MNIKEKISRNNFLRQLGFSGISLMAVYGLGACANDSMVLPTSDFTLDLSESRYAKLKNSGSYVIVNQIVIANNNGTYIAATLKCSHENKNEIIYQNKEWYCTAHGARFDLTGKGLNGDAKKGLKVYNTSLNNNMLTIMI